MATIDDILGSPDFLRQLIGEEQFAKSREQALNQGILQASLAALGGRGNTGQVLAQAGTAGIQGFQSGMDRTLADITKSMQLREMIGGKSPELSKEQQQYAFQKYGNAKFSTLTKDAQQDVLDFGQRPDINKAQDGVIAANKLFADTGIDLRPDAMAILSKARGITPVGITAAPVAQANVSAPSGVSSVAPASVVSDSVFAGLPPSEQIKLKAADAAETMKAQRALPQAVETAKQTVATVDKLLVHPGFENLVGLGVPFGKLIPGSQTAGANALFLQIKGKSFLEAFQSLKGAGAITEQEGAKAETAINRMNTVTSEADFNEAAKDFKEAVQAGIDRASKSANKPTQDVAGIDITNIPSAASQMLRKDPRLASEFDAKYGKGAASKVLGKK